MMRDRTLVIVNPAAGSGRAARRWLRLRDKARTLFGFEEAQTARPGDATRLTADAAKAGITRILAVGGDGTLHEIANGAARTPMAVGVLPLGTGNDFARSAGLFRPALALLAGMAVGGCRTVDLGRVHGRYYVNVAGVGFDAEVARIVNAMSRKAGGTVPYLATAVRQAFRYVPPTLSLLLDQCPALAPEPRLLIAVGNASAYGGGMRICPRAQVDDGLLDVLCVGDVRRWSTLGLLPKVFMGAHLADPRVHYHRARDVKIGGDPAVALHADGELLGGLPATFSVCPGALKLWVPA